MTSHRFTTIKKEPAYLKVYQAVSADILSGKLPEGSALPTEEGLCAQFGVNRSTVREGIRLLEQTGAIERRGGRKLVVVRPLSEQVASRTSHSMLLSGVSFSQALAALALIQPEAAAWAAEHIAADDADRLRAAVRRLEDIADDDHAAIIAASVEFFTLIGEAMRNPVLLVILQSLSQVIGISLAKVVDRAPHARSRILHAQREIVHALAAHDPEAARAWMRRHIEDLKRGYEVAGIDLDSRIS